MVNWDDARRDIDRIAKSDEFKRLAELKDDEGLVGQPENLPELTHIQGIREASVEYRDVQDVAVEDSAMSSEMLRITAVVLAAWCRLQHLEGKLILGRPFLTGEDAELTRLQQWKQAIGRDKQERIKLLSENLSKEISVLEYASLSL